MDGQTFIRLVKKAFNPFMREFGFSMGAPSVDGLIFSVDFTHRDCVVTVAIEPPDLAVHTLIFSREGEQLSAPDDLLRTPRLSDLVARHMRQASQAEQITAKKKFAAVHAPIEDQRLLLKAARELYLVLPKHLASLQAIA